VCVCVCVCVRDGGAQSRISWRYTRYVWHGSFIRVTWRICMYDMAHSNVWHGLFAYDSCVRETWLTPIISIASASRQWCKWPISMCGVTDSYDMAHSYVCRDVSHSYMSVSHSHDQAHSHVWRGCLIEHGSFLCFTRLISICDMAHSFVWHVGWPWLVGSLKI